MTRVACQQLAPVLGDLDGNRERAREAVRAALDAGARVVVLPELATSGYMFESVEEAAAVAVTPAHPLFDDWANEAARGRAVVIGGFCERAPDRRLYNSAAVVGADGVLAVYRKLHLWDREKLWFTPGEAAPPVVDTEVGRIGVLICYDLEFPELTRSVALAGTELLAVPTNWPLVHRPAGERPPEVVIAMAAARVNRMAIACCDRTGTERGQRWTQGTTIVGSDGWPLAATTHEGLICAEVDLAMSRTKKLTELADLFTDRRPDFYDRHAR